MESTLYNTQKYLTKYIISVHIHLSLFTCVEDVPFFFPQVHSSSSSIPPLCGSHTGEERRRREEEKREPHGWADHMRRGTHCVMEAVCSVHWTLAELIHHNGSTPLNLSLHRHTQTTLRWCVWCGWCPSRHREERRWSPDGADAADGCKGKERMSERKGGNEYRFFFFEKICLTTKIFFYFLFDEAYHSTQHIPINKKVTEIHATKYTMKNNSNTTMKGLSKGKIRKYSFFFCLFPIPPLNQTQSIWKKETPYETIREIYSPFFIRWSERTTPSLFPQYSDWEHRHFFLSFIRFSSFVGSTSHTENSNAMCYNEWTFSHGAIKIYFTKNARTNEIELPRPKHDCALSSLFNISCTHSFPPPFTYSPLLSFGYIFIYLKYQYISIHILPPLPLFLISHTLCMKLIGTVNRSEWERKRRTNKLIIRKDGLSSAWGIEVRKECVWGE